MYFVYENSEKALIKKSEFSGSKNFSEIIEFSITLKSPITLNSRRKFNSREHRIQYYILGEH